MAKIKAVQNFINKKGSPNLSTLLSCANIKEKKELEKLVSKIRKRIKLVLDNKKKKFLDLINE